MSATGVRHRPSWDFPRSPIAARHLVETGREHGVDAGRCLAGTGLTERELADPATEVQGRQELAIARNLRVAAAGDPVALGMETGRRYTLTNAGILGYALLASPTLRDAVTLGLRYAKLTSSFLTITLEESGADASFLLDDREIPPEERELLLARDLTAHAHHLPLLLGSSVYTTPARIELRLPELPDDPLAPLGLPVTLHFAADRNAITFPRDLLDRPMPAADPETTRICARQCETLLARRHRRTGLARKVHTRLLRDPAHVPSMAALAREFAVTERTLHRRLAAEGCGYRQLVEELRAALADELLGGGLTVEETARRLGYSETAAFTHAYTRWHGRPPSHHAHLPRPG